MGQIYTNPEAHVIGFDGDMNEKTNGHNGHGLANLSDDAVDAAWERCCARHLPPNRLFRLALGLGDPADEEESHHLEWCEQCRTVVERYRSTEQADDGEDCACECAPVHAASAGAHQGSGNGQVRQTMFPLGVSAVGTAQPGNVPDIVRANLKVHGPVLFPNGEVAFDTWQVGWLDCLSATHPALAEQIATLIVDRAHGLLLPRLTRQRVVLVCFGRTMHALGTRLAARLVERGLTHLRVVLAHDFYSPTLICAPKELRSADVTVMVDVIHTGGLLERLFSICRENAPAHIRGLVLIDQSMDMLLSEDVIPLWTDGPEARLALEQFRRTATGDQQRQLMRFEPNDEYAIALQEVAADPRSETDDPQVDDGSLLVQMVHQSGALRSDYAIARKRYPYVINVLDLFRDQDCRQRIVSMASHELADLHGGRTCLAYHSGRAARAGKIAKLLGAELHWPAIPLGNRSASFALSELQCKRIAAFENVVLVDAAIRTGDSLTAVTRAMDDMALRSGRRCIAFCILDALTRMSRSDLSARLDLDIRTLFSFPLSPPTERVRNWMNHQKAALRDALTLSGKFADVEPVLRTYCAPVKRSARHASPPTLGETISALHKASFDAHVSERATAYIDTACKEDNVGLIRHLPINQVVHDRSVQNLLLGVMFNSMKPSFKECAVFAAVARLRTIGCWTVSSRWQSPPPSIPGSKIWMRTRWKLSPRLPATRSMTCSVSCARSTSSA